MRRLRVRIARFISLGINQSASSPEARMSERPLSRQPSCGSCHCEEHIFFVCECGCKPHRPTGIYD